VAWTLTGLARTKADLGDRAAALALVQQAIAIFSRMPPRDPDYLPTALALRGSLEARAGDYRSARSSLDEALVSRERSLGSKHPLAASTRADIASVDLALGSYQPAFQGALAAESSARDLLRFTVRYVADRRAMEYASARPRGLDLALSVVADDHLETAGPQALDAVIQSRGIVLDELAARARFVSGADAKTASIAVSLADAQRRFAGLMLRGLGGQLAEPAVLERVRQEKEDAEEALAAQSAALRVELSRANAGLADVRRAMPAKSALISFVRYERTTYVAREDRLQRRIIPSYIAFLSRSDRSDVLSMPLGAAASLDKLIESWRDDVGRGARVEGVDDAHAERAYRVTGTRLRQRIWDPIAAQLAGVERIFIVPDAGLNLVSFAALPTPGRRYLIEDAPPVHYLSMERDLIVDPHPRPEHGLLLVGGPSYDAVASPRQSVGDRRRGCVPTGSLRFEDLPGSRAEVREIAALWSGVKQTGSDAGDVMVLSGKGASKSAVLAAAPGRTILHLATHGFFLDECRASMPGTRSVGGLVSRSRTTPSDTNPLLLAGLAFAGANAPADQAGHDAGILTAEEVSALNLQGTEWAVLSACDTGVGRTTSGEGVLGLRRAFQVAGVKTVIMSLWSVQDRATRDWMVALYRARLIDHLDTAGAVQQASLSLLRDRKAKGSSTHPFYWAAFAAAGDWR
jgi:CHAT domain-containing protein